MTKEEFDKALPIAIKMYKLFFNELMTGLQNRADTCEGAGRRNISSYEYLKGKADAFREIADRILKECYTSEIHDYEYFRGFQLAKNADIERIFPTRQAIGTIPLDRYEMNKKVLADMLEHYFKEGVRLGSKHINSKDVKEFIPDEFVGIFTKKMPLDEADYAIYHKLMHNYDE